MLPLLLSVLLGCYPLLALGVGAGIFGQIDEDTFHDFGLIGTNQRMSAQSVAVLGDYLYIEGGQVSTWVNGEQQFPLNTLERELSSPVNILWTLYSRGWLNSKQDTITSDKHEMDKERCQIHRDSIRWRNAFR